MSTFKFFADAGLTIPITGAGSIEFTQAAAGAPVDRLIYFGSPVAGKILRDAAVPGTDPLQVLVVDTNEAGGIPATAIKLALSAGGLSSATGGAALTIGTTLTSGAVNAVPVFVRVDAASATPAVFTDLLLRIPDVLESDA